MTGFNKVQVHFPIIVKVKIWEKTEQEKRKIKTKKVSLFFTLFLNQTESFLFSKKKCCTVHFKNTKKIDFGRLTLQNPREYFSEER
jgi:hypothetical protein